VAARYAGALFELAGENAAADAVGADLDRFDALVAGSEDLQRLIRSPVFDAEQQIAALGAILGRAGIGGLAANFIKLVAAKRRLFTIRDMVRGYRALLAQSKGIVRAEVTVAEPLPDALLAEVRQALAGVAGKDIALDMRINPQIIGGMVVKLGSRMIDASLKTKLNALRLAMKEVG
jgi:F-type H+-transporting ATPase subunit delta